METKDYLQLQSVLDQIIRSNIDPGKDVLNEKLIALSAELGEFFNECNTWKYWKKNKTINREKLKEEYVDILFFMFSIANDLEITAEDIENTYKEKWKINVERQKNNY